MSLVWNNFSYKHIHVSEDAATREVLFEKYCPPKEIEFLSVPVYTTTRRIGVQWTPELYQDLLTFQSINLEDELMGILNPNQSHTLSRIVIIEKWKPNIIWNDDVWPMEFTEPY